MKRQITFIGLAMMMLLSTHVLAENCGLFIRASEALQLQLRPSTRWSSITGLWVDRVWACDQGTCFEGVLYNLNTNRTLDPIEGHYNADSLYFAQIIDQTFFRRINHFHGSCGYNDASGEYLNQNGLLQGTFYLSR